MFKVVSTNIRFENPSDGHNNWPNRKDFLSSSIKDFNPDVIGTQEGWEFQLRDFHSLLTEYEIVDSHRDWIDDRMYPTLFIKKGIFDINKSGDIWLSETPNVPASKSFDSAFPRLCTWAELTYKKDNKQLIAVNVHLDHLQTQTRQKQINVLINEIRNVSSLPIILMGDFNEGPSYNVRKIINEKLDLLDPWLELNLQEETSHHSFEGKREDGERIDWVLHDSFLDPVDIYLFKESEDGRYPSDHYPVFATFKFS